LQQGVGKTAADLARAACHDTGAVTRLLDRLESKALIRRVRSEEDRRVVNLELTDEGSQVAADVPKVIAQLANQMLEGFSEEEFRQFQDYLRRALANAQALDQGENG
jgi:DNA-binding MarR family transcriptional regulator